MQMMTTNMIAALAIDCHNFVLTSSVSSWNGVYALRVIQQSIFNYMTSSVSSWNGVYALRVIQQYTFNYMTSSVSSWNGVYALPGGIQQSIVNYVIVWTWPSGKFDCQWKFLAIFWQSNGNFPEGQVSMSLIIVSNSYVFIQVATTFLINRSLWAIDKSEV